MAMTGGGGTMGGEQVHYNRDLLKGNHSRGGRHVPPVPPPILCRGENTM